MVSKSTKERNLERAISLVDQSVRDWGVKAVCLPEYFLSKIPDRVTSEQEMRALAEPIPGPSTEAIGKKAKEHGIFIACGLVELGEDGKLYDTAPLIGPDGKVKGKVSLCYNMLNTAIKHSKGSGLVTGDDSRAPRVFDTELGRIGLIAAEDFGSGDDNAAFKKMKSGNPDIIFNPVTISGRITESIIHGVSGNFASKLHCYYVIANVNGMRRNVKDIGDMTYNGNSSIINPCGQVFARTTVCTFRAMESIAVGMVDLKLLDNIRKNIADPEATARPW